MAHFPDGIRHSSKRTAAPCFPQLSQFLFLAQCHLLCIFFVIHNNGLYCIFLCFYKLFQLFVNRCQTAFHCFMLLLYCNVYTLLSFLIATHQFRHAVRQQYLRCLLRRRRILVLLSHNIKHRCRKENNSRNAKNNYIPPYKQGNPCKKHCHYKQHKSEFSLYVFLHKASPIILTEILSLSSIIPYSVFGVKRRCALFIDRNRRTPLQRGQGILYLLQQFTNL